MNKEVRQIVENKTKFVRGLLPVFGKISRKVTPDKQFKISTDTAKQKCFKLNKNKISIAFILVALLLIVLIIGFVFLFLFALSK
jgi:NADH:ubiquinone oxidoreductase subunit 3 (subunit A)